jgi:hypothetical protein
MDGAVEIMTEEKAEVEKRVMTGSEKKDDPTG